MLATLARRTGFTTTAETADMLPVLPIVLMVLRSEDDRQLPAEVASGLVLLVEERPDE